MIVQKEIKYFLTSLYFRQELQLFPDFISSYTFLDIFWFFRCICLIISYSNFSWIAQCQIIRNKTWFCQSGFLIPKQINVQTKNYHIKNVEKWNVFLWIEWNTLHVYRRTVFSSLFLVWHLYHLLLLKAPILPLLY